MPNLTIISHFFNEEYLLPFWLEYHSTIFENGVMIDYCSTDNSTKIINKICPNWKIIKTKNIKSNGSPNFEAKLVDDEVKEIEKTIEGYKICLNTTEFLFFEQSTTEEFINSLSPNMYYHLAPFSIMTKKVNTFPTNLIDFFQDIQLIDNKISSRGHRILHSDSELNYCHGRHSHYGGNNHTNVYRSDAVILWTGFYPCNSEMITRKLQIQTNIPQCDKDNKAGWQHIVNHQELLKMYNTESRKHYNITDNQYEYILKMINNTCCNKLKKNIHYSNLIFEGNWGDNIVILNNDINLLNNTDFDNTGYKIININNNNVFLQNFIKDSIKNITGKYINLENYHNEITDEEHSKILNSMPYKKDTNEDMQIFCNYIEKIISLELKENVKIFNNDVWVRICRPSIINDNDYNPCHKDVYLDFYRNIVNIYLPIVGSNEKSSLSLQPGSHKWNENETMVTKGGAFFKYINKKYSVDAIVASKTPIEMIRPNPCEGQLMLFSPYLIHGCAYNENENTTRISLEVRFIKNDENGLKQEVAFNDFLKIRDWR
jgi:hypothetical protein